ncbi:nucleotidyltransferase domain-containing protein [Butyrivibrio sp. INlla14]|uniref:nucleotidyltransferase domain-containing protein n=1 Tax=Butyrivibrio sp. INlla14 TaxID=1520808 RepID=UPI000877483E|nr:nucleotidyltransferase family protein [Butyrivibrio sp. INlla14]SCY64778.1 Uncharacterised nucleotidyltransferase [Butyrivibrio sp. INlla14]
MAETLVDIRLYYAELIRACLEKRKPAPIPEKVSLNDLLSYAKTGQISYPIFSSLIKLDIDEEHADTIRQALKLSTFRTFMQMGAFTEITNALEAAGIRHQVLKGAIIKRDYPSPEIREMSDIDLVIYDESLDKAAKVMEKLGYKNHGIIKHHMIFTKGNDLYVEVHWCLFDESVGHSQHLYFNDFRARRIDGKKYTYEFSHEDFYVYLIAHMAKHFFETGCGIRNLMDIYIYVNKYGEQMDKEYLDKELEKCGIRDFEREMRELAFIWLDSRDCPEFYENLFAYMLDSGIYGKGENGVWGQLAKETVAGNRNIKVHYYFPSIKFMKEKYTWLNKAPFLLPIAWAVRGVCGVSSKTSREHRQQLESTDKDNVEKMLDIYHRLNLNFRK